MIPSCFDDYLAELDAVGRDPKTIASYRQSLRAVDRLVVQHLDPDLNLLDLTRLDAIRLMHAMHERYAPGAADTLVRVLSMFYRWCVATGNLELNPMASLPRIRVPRREQAAVGLDGAARMMSLTAENKWPNRARLALLLAFCCGLRISEVAGLTVDDLTDDADDGAPGVLVRGKAGHERWVPLPSTVRAVLADYLPEREARIRKYGHELHEVRTLLVGSRPNGGLPVTDPRRMEYADRRSLQRDLYPLFRAIGLPSGVGMHAARRGFATIGCAEGGPFDTYTMEVALGHATQGTIGRYRLISRPQLAALFERHPMNVSLGGWLRAAA